MNSDLSIARREAFSFLQRENQETLLQPECAHEFRLARDLSFSIVACYSDYVKNVYDSVGFSQVTVWVPVGVEIGSSIGTGAKHNIINIDFPIIVNICRMEADNGRITVVCIVRFNVKIH